MVNVHAAIASWSGTGAGLRRCDHKTNSSACEGGLTRGRTLGSASAAELNAEKRAPTVVGAARAKNGNVCHVLSESAVSVVGESSWDPPRLHTVWPDTQTNSSASCAVASPLRYWPLDKACTTNVRTGCLADLEIGWSRPTASDI